MKKYVLNNIHIKKNLRFEQHVIWVNGFALTQKEAWKFFTSWDFGSVEKSMFP